MFLLSRRWIGFALFVAILATVCVRLGFWQYHRLEDRLAANKIIAAHLKADPVELTEVVGADDPVREQDEWARVKIEGRYDTAHQVTVRFSTRDGQPGVDVVTPLVTGSGQAVLVNRGWMSTNNSADKPADVPEPPSGDVAIEGWLRPNSGADSQAVTPEDEQVRAVSSRGMASAVPYDLHHGYVNLLNSSPSGTSDLDSEPAPDQGQGPHLFYAIQWWFFAALALFGFGYFAYLEHRERRQRRQLGTSRAVSSQARSTNSA